MEYGWGSYRHFVALRSGCRFRTSPSGTTEACLSAAGMGTGKRIAVSALWELANGVSSGPEHVTAWLRTMQRQGHYPRPEGYVDPEVLRLRQQADEERELAEARTRFK